MLLKKLKIIFTAAALVVTLQTNVQAQTFTSAKVITAALGSNSCLNYSIIGQCVYMYLSCSLFGGCGLKIALRDQINHNLPDLVVTAFREPGETPYTEIRSTASIAAVAIMNSEPNYTLMGRQNIGGSYFKGMNKPSHNDVMTYNEANVVGSPAAEIVRNTLKYTVPSINGGPFLCKSTVQPLFPYFMSEIDVVAWRTSHVNFANSATWIPGKREISHSTGVASALKTWGGVYPRVGHVMQNEPSKAAAVVSQRAIDIMTQPNQIPHIYTPYGYTGVRMFPAPPESYECGGDDGDGNWNFATCNRGTSFAQWMGGADEKRVAWQMLIPQESSSCEAFGAEGEWARGKTTEHGNNGWNYWREYTCCKPGPGWLIYP